MKITEIEDPEFMSRLGRSHGPRTQGVVHLSDIYKILMQRLQPKRFVNGPMNMASIEIGLAFENAIERELAIRHSVVRPGEVVSDEGVWMSPDGVNPDLCAGEEYKFTTMGLKEGISDIYGNPHDKFYHWFVQVLGYAKWLDVDRYVIRVGSSRGVNGWQPAFRSYMLEFTKDEKEQNWAMLMNIAKEEGLL